jgi:ABC-type dipeptide/oligopeptide/nickel transport system ATPase component|tara:strand:+ start:970 stop:1725 length:756 start_codon:yes stop_codon:yes gene_type:complete
MFSDMQQIQDTLQVHNVCEQQRKECLGELYIKRIQKRILTKNYITLFLGETGSGKSWASLRLAEQLDPNFTHDNVIYTQKDFHEKIQNAKPYSAFVYEEVGVNMASHDFWKNITTNAILQTFRHQHLILIMNCPVIDFISRQAVKLIHSSYLIKSMNKQGMFSTARALHLQTDGQFNFTKQASPIIQLKDGEKIMVESIKIKAPSLKLRRDYERASEEYKIGLKEEMRKKAEVKEAIRSAELRKKFAKIET